MNGRLKSSIRNDYTANTTSPLVLGELLDDPNSVSSFMGEMDELRVWNYARTQQEIEAGMYDKMTGTEEEADRILGFGQYIRYGYSQI